MENIRNPVSVFMIGCSERESVAGLICILLAFPLPIPKSLERLLAHQRDHWNLALRIRPRYFLVSQRISQTDFRGALRGFAKIPPRRPRPVDRAQTHGTRFAGGIE